MKEKSNIEIKHARIKDFRLCPSNSGTIPEFTVLLEQYGMATSMPLKVFGTKPCETNFIYEIIALFDVTHKCGGFTNYYARIVFHDNVPVGISTICEMDDWMVCTKEGYKKISIMDLPNQNF